MNSSSGVPRARLVYCYCSVSSPCISCSWKLALSGCCIAWFHALMCIPVGYSRDNVHRIRYLLGCAVTRSIIFRGRKGMTPMLTWNTFPCQRDSPKSNNNGEDLPASPRFNKTCVNPLQSRTKCSEVSLEEILTISRGCVAVVAAALPNVVQGCLAGSTATCRYPSSPPRVAGRFCPVCRTTYTSANMGTIQDDQTGKMDSEGPATQEHAAQLIQRNYRGYRERRQLQGMGLDASARWAEVRGPGTMEP